MTTKIAVSLPDELVVAAKEAVSDGRFASVSAYVASAMRSYAASYTLRDWLDEVADELGPIPQDANDWARSVYLPHLP
jgi:Arc/MetJ-type ribon-helix-helix transcriptional regulator